MPCRIMHPLLPASEFRLTSNWTGLSQCHGPLLQVRLLALAVGYAIFQVPRSTVLHLEEKKT